MIWFERMTEFPCFVKGSFPESPSQGFRENNSSFAPFATLRFSFPYFHKRNILLSTIFAS